MEESWHNIADLCVMHFWVICQIPAIIQIVFNEMKPSFSKRFHRLRVLLQPNLVMLHAVSPCPVVAQIRGGRAPAGVQLAVKVRDVFDPIE